MSKPGITRRDFLRGAAAAVAAAEAARPALGAPALLPPASIGTPVRYGFIGTGTEGCNLLRRLTTIPAGRCVATCDIYPPNLKKGVETIGSSPQTFTEYRQLLERKDIDAVLIATPLYLHARMVVDALEAGKHVFVEKAMFFKDDEEGRIRNAAAAHPKQVLQIGLQRRFSGIYRAAVEMIRKGALGKVMFIRANWHRNSNWRRPVADPIYERLLNWRLYRDYSGGLMAELASHQIDVANWVFGAEPISVIGMGGIDYWKDGREVDDNIEAVFEFPGGRRLAYTSILFNSHYEFVEQIMGDQGTLEITLGHAKYYREPVVRGSSARPQEVWQAGATVTAQAEQKGVRLFPKETAARSSSSKWSAEYVAKWLGSMGIEFNEPHNPYWSELSNFLASIRDGKPIACPLETGVADARAVIYGNRAIDTGQKVVWPKTKGEVQPGSKAGGA